MESKIFSVTEGKIKTQRQQDLELASRFVALAACCPFSAPQNQTLDDFLNETVDKSLRHWDDAQWSQVSAAFNNALQATAAIFGRHLFRKSVGYSARSPINRGLFEAQLISISALSANDTQSLIQRKAAVIAALKEDLRYGTALSISLLYATGSADASNTRIQEMTRIFNEVIHVA
ncbi:MAG: hypothetical protein IPJ50_16540 [Betaproteobacteria bacterium]|nr:hypothetical protein [Betaproteobacteria bacterium]